MGGSDDVIGGWILDIQNADRREAKISALESALHDTEQALAEKERELQQIREHEFQNGYREGEAVAKVEKTEQYQWLMAQAVRFASTVEDCNWVDGTDEWAAREFLRSPEAQAFLKEHP